MFTLKKEKTIAHTFKEKNGHILHNNDFWGQYSFVFFVGQNLNYFGQFQHFKEELKIIIIVKLFFQYGIDKTMYTEDMHFECILTNEGICFSCGMVSLYG